MKLSELKKRIDEQLERKGDNDIFISVDVGTSEKYSVHRIFADIINITSHGDIGFAILSEMTEDNEDSLKENE